MTIRKLDASGQELIRYSGDVIERTSDCVVVEAEYRHPNLEMPGLTFRTGDVFVETHCSDRWYNVFEVHDGASGELKGWYCNITRPALIEDGQIEAEDLALDLVVRPDGNFYVLDRDEFAELDLSDADREAAQAALIRLQSLAERMHGPFALGKVD